MNDKKIPHITIKSLYSLLRSRSKLEKKKNSRMLISSTCIYSTAVVCIFFFNILIGTLRDGSNDTSDILLFFFDSSTTIATRNVYWSIDTGDTLLKKKMKKSVKINFSHVKLIRRAKTTGKSTRTSQKGWIPATGID